VVPDRRDPEVLGLSSLPDPLREKGRLRSTVEKGQKWPGVFARPDH